MTMSKKGDSLSHSRFYIASKGIGFRHLLLEKSLQRFISEYISGVRTSIS